MKIKVSIAIILLLCVAAGAFFAGTWFESRKARHELALRTYRDFEAQGFAHVASDFDDPLWRRELGDELEQRLSQPWSGLVDNDAAWGMAYRVMRDHEYSGGGLSAHTNWLYRDGMPQTQQDDLIRYMCFRIEKAAHLHGVSAERELQALVTYPQEAINRSQDMVSRAVMTGARSGYNEVTVPTVAYIVHLADLDWGREMCWTCLNEARNNEDRFVYWRSYLAEEAQGGDTFVTFTLHCGKPSPELQAGAAQVVARVMQSVSPEVENQLGLWKNDYALFHPHGYQATTSSRPASQPSK